MTMLDTQEILALNAFQPQSSGSEDISPDLANLLKRRQQAYGAASVLFYQRPLHLVRGAGVFVYDTEGRQYLDFYNNVMSVGHCHPRVAQAIARQSAQLTINSRYLYDIALDYAERLLAYFPPPLTQVIFTCTGSESNDLALRIARTVTERMGVIVSHHAYHGNTTAVTEVSPASYRSGSQPPYVRTVPAPSSINYGSDIATGFANAVAEQVYSLQKSGFGLAALLVDTIFSSDGVFTDPVGFLAPAVTVIREAGGLWIADEVQPGFGRTGRMWGFERHHLVPDMVTLGKPMGNGYPIAAVVTRPDYLEKFCQITGYFNTFAGNPVAAAAGLAVLETLEAENLLEKATQIGAYLRSQLIALQKLYPQIADVRGDGLYVGVELGDPQRPAPELATCLINHLYLEKQILVGAAGPFANVLKIRPPLCLSKDHVDSFTDALAALLSRFSQ